MNGAINVSGEEQVLSSTFKDNLVQTGFIDGKVIGIPSINTSLVQVNDGDLDVVALVSDDRTSRPT